MFYTKYQLFHLSIINIHRNAFAVLYVIIHSSTGYLRILGRFLAKKIKKIYEVNGIVVVSIIDVEDRDYE